MSSAPRIPLPTDPVLGETTVNIGTLHAGTEANIIPAPAGLIKREGDITREVPHTWLSITIFEGKFRQVRKMVAAIGHPCKRLIRVSIEDIHLGNLEAGGIKEMDETEFFRLLKIVFVPPAISGK